MDNIIPLQGTLKIVKVSGSKGGNQVVEVRKNNTKCVYEGTKRQCSKYIALKKG